MTTANEAAQARTALGSALKAGIDTLSLNQTITFDLYARTVLPFDGYVFWIKASQLTPTALIAAVKLNSPADNSTIPPLQIVAQGSLHFSTDKQQEEDSSFTINHIRFTSEQEIQDLNYVGPQLIYIASFSGIRFAFASRSMFYEQADTWHYVGNAIYSTMESQIIDDPSQFDENQLVVSNSLPAWLAINSYNPIYPVLVPKPTFTLFPSFISPYNIPPPFATIHIEPENTTALQALPYLNSTLSHYQLAHDRVIVTFYGINNDRVQNFVDYINQYTLDTELFGIMGVPAIARDDKRVQTELGILAMKKHIIFEVSYNQISIRNIARQLVEKSIATYLPQCNPFQLSI